MKLTPTTVNALRHVWEDNDLPGKVPDSTSELTDALAFVPSPIPKHLRTLLKSLEVRILFTLDQSSIAVMWVYEWTTGETGTSPIALLYRLKYSWDCSTPRSHSFFPIDPYPRDTP